MEPDEIRDGGSLEGWLKGRPREEALYIAQRAALRVLPVWVEAREDDRARERASKAQPVLRAILTSGVARKFPTSAVKDAAARAVARATAAAARAADAFAARATAAAARAARPTADVAADAFAARAAADVAADTFATRAAAARAARAAFATRAAAARAARATDAFALRVADAATAAWAEIRADARALLDGTAETRPLWAAMPGRATPLIGHMRDTWAPATPGGAFWMRWYQGFLDGTPLPWDLQRDIALIPDEDWQKGEAHLARLIEAIEAEHLQPHTAPDPVAQEAAALPAARPATIQRIRAAITENRDAPPPTFDAIEGYIALEIERLQRINYTSDDHAEECRRQIAVLAFLDSAVKRLRATIPAERQITEAEANKAERLYRVFARHLAEWPRINMPEIVDGVYRGGLVCATATLGALCGLPPTHALGAGIVLFGGKKIGEAIKIAKDAPK
jgi:hypothetical protein